MAFHIKLGWQFKEKALNIQPANQLSGLKPRQVLGIAES
jgi:hypothetical protein